MADPDDEKTIFEGSEAAAPATAAQTEGDNSLPVGTRLGEFELIGLVGIGGFGIVYLAEDHSLGRRVAVKEYMPSALASRGDGSQVRVKSERHAETFEAGRRSFVNEARLLAQFDHPALIKVYRFWEANGTAYMVMPYYEGTTLKRALHEMAAAPDEAWLKRLLVPLLDALEVLHAANVFHRDIAPDNILLLSGEQPLLLDFGAARQVISDMTQALTVILKPGYAPVEQYAETPELKQGAWTDMYALAAVIHFAILGRTPPPAVGRMMNDTMAPLVQQAEGRYSEAFLRAVDRCLAVKPDDRPQSIGEFRTMLGIDQRSVPAATARAPVRGNGATPAGSRSRKPLLLSGVAALAAFAIGGYFLAQSGPSSQPPAPVVSPDMPVPSQTTPTPPSAPIAAPRPPSPEAPQSAPSQASTPAPETFSALDEIERIFQQRNREHSVTVALEKTQVRIDQDRLNFRVRSSKSGYLYVLMVGTDSEHLYKLFPNAVDTDNRVGAGTAVELPRAGWVMVAGGPPGFNQFAAVVSENPRDFSATGLAAVGPFTEFPIANAADLAARHTGVQSPFLGKVVCPDGSSACSDAYGASIFTIEEIVGSEPRSTR